jgi:adenosylcobinamide kinase/adenosylcobinamide-phosphate guanylyltransferase
VITLLTGGVKSGKSSRALDIARSWQKPVTFIASAVALDDEMKARIARHREERLTLGFKTIEEPLNIAQAVERGGGRILFDCLTMWVNNLMYYRREDDFAEMLNDFIRALRTTDDAVIVTNETGLGNIPGDAITRRYNLLLAEANRKIAAMAGRVEFMVSGLVLPVKG